MVSTVLTQTKIFISALTLLFPLLAVPLAIATKLVILCSRKLSPDPRKSKNKQTKKAYIRGEYCIIPIADCSSVHVLHLNSHLINVAHCLHSSCSQNTSIFHTPGKLMNQSPLCLLLIISAVWVLDYAVAFQIYSKTPWLPLWGDIRQQTAYTKNLHYPMHLPFLHRIYERERVCWQGF